VSAHILVVDDEPLIRLMLRRALVQEGCEVSLAESGEQGWQIFQSARPDVVLLDLVLGDIDGLEVLRRMIRSAPETKVIVISAHGSIESAVQAMKLGGYDFIKKPFEIEEIVAAVRNAARTSRLEGRLEYLTQREKNRIDADFIYRSAAMQAVVREVELIAKSPVHTVLILGESGTGKQHIARMLHELSPRSAGPFVELNCSAVPEHLVESEFFGHERGAFSDARERKLGLVEVADGGTLFLDEIGDLGAAAQAKLLTFLEQHTFRRVGATALRRVDTRVVAATNRDLEQLAVSKAFRSDLMYRLNGITISVPPLRERPEDIAPLAEHFLLHASRDLGRRWHSLSRAAASVLESHPWPGNVRELRAVISRAALLHDAEELGPEHLPVALQSAALRPPLEPSPPTIESAGALPTLAEMELSYIRRMLALCSGNRSLAAQRLGISRQTLAKKIDSGGEPPERT